MSTIAPGEWYFWPTASRESVSGLGPMFLQHQRCDEKVPVYADTRTFAQLMALAEGHSCPPQPARTWEGDQA